MIEDHENIDALLPLIAKLHRVAGVSDYLWENTLSIISIHLDVICIL